MSQERIIKSLNVLGLDSSATQEQITDRVKVLKSIYNSESEADAKKMDEVYRASKFLLENYELLSKGLNENTDQKNSQIGINVDDAQPKRKHSKKKIIWISVISGIFALFLISFLTQNLPKMIEDRNQYNEIKEMMMNFNADKMNTIGETIKKLPDDYKDIKTISSQYELIMENVEIITESENTKGYKNWKGANTAYRALININHDLSNWNLSQYLDNKDIRYKIIWTKWSDLDKNFQIYSYNFDYNYDLNTNLPNNIESDKFYITRWNDSWTKIGYENLNDPTDKFWAYEIIDVKEDQIQIYCYSNSETYTLYYTDQD